MDIKISRSFRLFAIFSILSACSQSAIRDREGSGVVDPVSDPMTEWLQWSGDLYNTHSRIIPESRLNRDSVRNLRQLWFYPTKSGVSGIPTVKDGTVYFGDNGKTSPKGFSVPGYFYALKTDPGNSQKVAQEWEFSAAEMSDHPTRNVARISPAIAGNYLITGTALNGMRFIWNAISRSYKKIPGASVVALDRKTHKILWRTQVSGHFSSRITASPVIYKGKVYVGVSAEESQIPGIIGKAYRCCDFRGSLVALDLVTGKILWQKYTISERALEQGFSGAAIWGSSFPIDDRTNTIFVGTGNNYTAPERYKKCLMSATNNPIAIDACAKQYDLPDNYFDSILAFDLNTGALKWATKTTAYDAWNVSCGSRITIIPPKRRRVCPEPPGTDSDFGQAPMFVRDVEVTYQGKKQKLDVLVGAQKNGNVYLFNARNGDIVWKKFTGQGGDLGGHEWGSATDGKRIYLQTTNLEHDPYLLQAGEHHGEEIRSGYWTALDIRTGETIWETPDPAYVHPIRGGKLFQPLYSLKPNLGVGHFAAPLGPLTLYNGILFVGSLSGNFHALDSENGRVLWSKEPEEGRTTIKASSVSAPAIVNDRLYWGIGYTLGFDKEPGMYSFGL